MIFRSNVSITLPCFQWVFLKNNPCTYTVNEEIGRVFYNLTDISVEQSLITVWYGKVRNIAFYVNVFRKTNNINLSDT